MPFLERNKNKNKKNESGEVLPWERYSGYWDTLHGRLARERREAMIVADLHPEAVYQARRRHAAEQCAATTARPGSMPQFASGRPMSSPSEQSDFRRGARKFAEAHPEVVNHYAHCDGSCENDAMRDAGTAFDRGWGSQNPSYSPGAYQNSALQHHISTGSPHYNTLQEVHRVSQTFVLEIRLKDEQAAELRLWATGRLELLTETNPKILADYAVQLLNGDSHIEDVRKDVFAGLQDILLEDTTQFVAELFVKATSHLRPPDSVPSTLAASRPVTRNPLPIFYAQSDLRSAAPLSNASSGLRKRNYAQAHGYEGMAHHTGKHRVCKRSRGRADVRNGINRGNWGGRGRDFRAATGSHTQPVDLKIGNTPFDLPNLPTTPPDMPEFLAIIPYMVAMMNTQGMMAKKGKCENFDVYGYCMRGDACSYDHTKQAPDFEARHQIGGYASDNKHADGIPRKKAQFIRRVPSTPNTPTTRNPSRTISYSTNETSITPEELDESRTPVEPEIDIEVFKVEQNIKQQDHKIRIATLKDNQSQREILARKTAELEAKLAAEKAKLMAQPADDKILAQISAEQTKKDTAGQALDSGIEADVMSLGGTPDRLLLRTWSAQSDALRYLGKNQAICRFFPNCTNRTCSFKHTADSPASVVLCKFFPNCAKRDCIFKHVSAVPTSKVLCKFFPECTKGDCMFKHPGGRPTSNVQRKFRPNCTNDAYASRHGDGGVSDINCKYYPNCTNPRCRFKHPEGSVCSGAFKRVNNQPKNLLISGVTASFSSAADSMNMVRVAVMGISPCESIQLQSFHDPKSANGGNETHDGLVVTFAERWQAEEVQRRLTMVGGVGRVKCAWYFGPMGGVAGERPRMELEADSVYEDGWNSADGGDIKMNEDVKADVVRIKDEDLDVAVEEDWAAII